MQQEQALPGKTSKLLLCAAIALALNACGTDQTQSGTAPTPPVSATATQERDDHISADQENNAPNAEKSELLVAGANQQANAIVSGQHKPPVQMEPEAPARTKIDQLLQRGQRVPSANMTSERKRSMPSARFASIIAQPVETNRENYAHTKSNSIKLTQDEPVSTFSIDVDTGAYANVRRYLNNDQLPPQDAVRVEELINYFNYDYPEPAERSTPFSVSTELSRTPWNDDTWLLHVGLKGYEVPANERPAANLVFLLDVSGSMNSPNKLPLLKKSFRMLTKQLNDNDRISIVVYAGASGIVLEPTPGDNHRTIAKALRRLQAGGSTNGAAGIELAYELAEEAFIENGINRIVLATDGDFNVGTVNFEQLKDLAERKRKSGVSLTTLGFGTGNYNDHLLEQLADAGNGNYAYIDSQQEARKVLVNEVTSTLHTIAKDVKIQIEFNPDVVAEYRLIGYENRILNREDFTNDKVDAGEIGAGHTVTALYELTPTQSTSRSVIPLRYQQEAKKRSSKSDKTKLEAAFVRLRYKQPDAEVSTEISTPILSSEVRSLARSSDNLRFSAAVAAFGQMLNGSSHMGGFEMNDVVTLARGATKKDRYGYRHEFIDLASTAELLTQEAQSGSLAQTD